MYNEDAFKFISEQIRKSLQPSMDALFKVRDAHISTVLENSKVFESAQASIARSLTASMPDISAIMRSSMPDISALVPSLKIANQTSLISQNALRGIDTEIMKSFHDSMALQRADLYKSISGIDFGSLSLATARRMAEQESDGTFTEEDAQAAVEFAEDAAPGWSERIRDLTGDVKDRAVELLPAAAGVVLWVLMTFFSLVILGVLNDTEALVTVQNIFAGILNEEVARRVTKIIRASGDAVKDKSKDPDEIE